MTEAVDQAETRSLSNHLLRKDVRFLGNILGEVLVGQGGNELLEKWSRWSLMAQQAH